MRVDELGRHLDISRGDFRGIPVSSLPAIDLQKGGVTVFRRTGLEVREAFGALVHYTRSDILDGILASDTLGKPDNGVWLTPSAYAGCMVPYDLGLLKPVDAALILDVSALPELWGPGSASPSTYVQDFWRGGGIEFYVASPFRLGAALLDVVQIHPCGDQHR